MSRIAIVLIILLIIIFLLSKMNMRDEEQSTPASVAIAFMNNVLAGDYPSEQVNISQKVRTASEEYCPKHDIASCIYALLSFDPEQEHVQYHVLFDGLVHISEFETNVALALAWETPRTRDQAVVIVLLEKSGTSWLVGGWRGLITGSTYDGEVNALLCNALYTNQFPPLLENTQYVQSFRFAQLQGSDFSNQNLAGAQFSFADLSGADLSGANLSNVDFRHANLQYADLHDTNLSFANLTGTRLNSANLINANLEGTFFFAAQLPLADLREATITNTYFNSASLNGMILPHGEFYESSSDLFAYSVGNIDTQCAQLQR